MDEVPSPSGEKAQMSEISDEDLEDKAKEKEEKNTRSREEEKEEAAQRFGMRTGLIYQNRDRRSRSSTGNEPSDIKAGLTKEDIDENSKKVEAGTDKIDWCLRFLFKNLLI